VSLPIRHNLRIYGTCGSGRASVLLPTAAVTNRGLRVQSELIRKSS